MGFSCLGCGEMTDEGELCPACRASARRQTRILAILILVLVGSAIVTLIGTSLR